MIAAPRALHILVIEDNDDAADLLRLTLELSGHKVEVASCGEAGLEAARRLQPEVVICDLWLPEMSGYAVAKALRGDPATAKARLIAFSGSTTEKHRLRSMEAGFDFHLNKPVDSDKLPELISLALEGQANP